MFNKVLLICLVWLLHAIVLDHGSGVFVPNWYKASTVNAEKKSLLSKLISRNALNENVCSVYAHKTQHQSA